MTFFYRSQNDCIQSTGFAGSKNSCLQNWIRYIVTPNVQVSGNTFFFRVGLLSFCEVMIGPREETSLLGESWLLPVDFLIFRDFQCGPQVASLLFQAVQLGSVPTEQV